MKLKIFQELNRAAQSADTEALQIFRAISKQLEDGGMSWEDVPLRISGTPTPTPRPTKNKNRPIQRTVHAESNIGPAFVSLHKKYQFVDRNTPGIEPSLWKWRAIEKEWLQQGQISASQIDQLQPLLPDMELKKCTGKATPTWLAEHKRTIETIEQDENTKARDCLISLQKERAEILHHNRKRMSDFVTAANSDRKLLVYWATVVGLISSQARTCDMKSLLDAAEKSAEDAESMAICLLLEIMPSKLGIPAPTISTARSYLTQHETVSGEKFLISLSSPEPTQRFNDLKGIKGVSECISALNEAYSEKCD
tara:strand:+ start:25191 stop:26120 length:930 start_codon:yes stop_codon:yes gene_type:complete